MRAAVALAVAALGGASVAHAQPRHLEPDEVAGGAVEPEPPVVELLTFGVGERIFETFGHAAICLRYHEVARPAVCFNYGVTDFSAGATMVWDFLRTQQKFWVEPTSFAAMFGFYRWEDRDIWVQTLPITGAAARAIEDRLWSDIQEANRYYNYDHFRDNCTTRLRDMIDQATGGALRAGSEARHALTFRELGRRGIADRPVLLVLSDLVTGRQLDDHPTLWEAMFLPDVLRQQVAARLGAAPRLLYQRKGPPFPVDGPSGRLEMFAIAMAFALPVLLAQWRRRMQTAAVAWLALGLGVVGLAVWGLAILSSIPGVRFNEAVFVVVPLDLALPVLGPELRRRYALGRIAMLALCSLLATIGVLHQPLWTLILAVFVAMAIIALDLPHGLRARRRPAVEAAPSRVPAEHAAAIAAQGEPARAVVAADDAGAPVDAVGSGASPDAVVAADGGTASATGLADSADAPADAAGAADDTGSGDARANAAAGQ